MATTEGTSTTSSSPITLQATIATTNSTTASVASPAQIAFPIQGIHLPSLDVLIYGVGDTEEQANADHDRKLIKLLERCQSQGIALNPDKPKLHTKSVTFMGGVLINEGIKIDPEKAKAIMDMPRPVDIEGVQRLNGFVNYLLKFLPRLADSMELIRRLTRKDE